MPGTVRTRTVRHRLADGTVKEYTYSIKKPKKRQSLYEPNTIGALLLAYEGSPEWDALAKSTKAARRIYLRELHPLKHYAATGLNRKIVLNFRDQIAKYRGKGAADVFTHSVRALLSWAVEREWIAHNPVTRVRNLSTGTLPTWTEAEARLAMRDLPEPWRRAVVLAYHTGQRLTDLTRMNWSAYDGAVIRLVQQKTKIALVIPAALELQAELVAWARDRSTTTILAGPTGKPWLAQTLSSYLSRELDRIGIARRLTIHGLRKLAATRLAEAGCSAHEIAAITGHKTLAMVQSYTRAADQERMAVAAVIRLQAKPGKR